MFSLAEEEFPSKSPVIKKRASDDTRVDISSQLVGITQLINSRSDGIEKKISNISAELKAVVEKVSRLEWRMNDVERPVAQMQRRMDDMETYARRRNLRLAGIPESAHEDIRLEVVKICQKALFSDAKEKLADVIDVGKVSGRYNKVARSVPGIFQLEIVKGGGGCGQRSKEHVRRGRRHSSSEAELSFKDRVKSSYLRKVPSSYEQMCLWQNQSPEPSCVSMKSDQSMGQPADFSLGDSSADLSQKHKGPESQTAKKNLDSIFKEIEHRIVSELKSFKRLLSPDYPECSERDHYDDEGHNRVREGLLKITLLILRKMNQTDLANTLQTKLMPVYQQKLKSRLQDKYQRISEGMSNHGDSTRLNEIYTELYITEGGSGEVNNEHEVRQIETVSRRPETQETPINCNDIFKPSPGQDKPIRTVLTKGVAGIGKTVSVQKFILDWAEGKTNQDVHFIFPLPFRELNLIQKNLSLVDLLNHLHTETKEFKSSDYEDYKVMFIFDGLDECRLRLDFQNNRSLSDVTESASVDVLLTNLIKGNLLPSALLWITSRPAAANQIPPECVHQVTEVRGFNDPQKEEYFRKRINDQSLADRVVTHIRSSRSLFIMCHIPVFCWISAAVLERMMGKAERAEIPKTLTQMFTHFLIFQTKLKTQKYDGKYEINPDQARKTILSLGKLAFEQLEKGNLIFYEEDLKESGIDVREVSVYSGVCTQIFREEFGLQLGKVYSFVHLSIQEFLAALFKLLSFSEQNTGLRNEFRSPMTSLLKREVDKALQSENGHWDLFLRFLLGLSLESNQTLLQGLLRKTVSSSDINQETAEYIKQKIRENPSPEKSINLFHCLNELNDRSLEQEVQTYLSRKDRQDVLGANCLSGVSLSAAQWSALVFVLLNSEEELDEFKLSKYDRSEECLLRLLPVIKASRKADLSGCPITQKGAALISALLEDPHCKLEKLE
ncbi:NLR family CARD domain-containing protein 3-like [Garra rufa]|uniref:NLR family CARD domain-containing protein 3-like n=1 Tax=Garra rufa TaxID=137080 RepID=UPI003CCE7240